LALWNYQPLTYQNGTYEYPKWAHWIGWTITGVTLFCIPAFAIFNICKAPGENLAAVSNFVIMHHHHHPYFIIFRNSSTPSSPTSMSAKYVTSTTAITIITRKRRTFICFPSLCKHHRLRKSTARRI
jgi:hypothetical protein